MVLDDFYGWLKYDEMLRLMDRYPMLVQTKGGQATFLAKKLLITSNTLPASWYPKISSDSRSTRMAPFYRRVDKWIYMGTHFSIATKTWQDFSEKLERLVRPEYDFE